ncbi:transposase [Tolypothrix campylonemoides VB511288]|nr:transposase [Tolypothrix campylonemoides VB511288]
MADLFPEAKPGGRPCTVALFAVVNAILYWLQQKLLHNTQSSFSISNCDSIQYNVRGQYRQK